MSSRGNNGDGVFPSTHMHLFLSMGGLQTTIPPPPFPIFRWTFYDYDYVTTLKQIDFYFFSLNSFNTFNFDVWIFCSAFSKQLKTCSPWCTLCRQLKMHRKSHLTGYVALLLTSHTYLNHYFTFSVHSLILFILLLHYDFLVQLFYRWLLFFLSYFLTNTFYFVPSFGGWVRQQQIQKQNGLLKFEQFIRKQSEILN